MGILDIIAGTVGLSKNDRERRELKNDLMREQTAGLKRQNKAFGDFEGLLNRSAPTDRLLDVEGGPPTLLSQLAPSAEAGITPGGSIPAVATGAGQRELTGILGQLAPAVTAQSLLPSARGNPLQAKISAFEEAVGRRATDSEAQHMAGAVPESSIETIMAEFELMRLKREVQNDETDDAIEDTTFSHSINTGVDQLFEMAEINSRRGEGGFLGKSGFGAETRGTGAGVLGMVGEGMGIEGAENLTQASNDITRFGDLTDTLALSRLDTEGFDANTNTKFNTFVGTKPDFSSGQGPTNLRIADNLEGMLLADGARGVGSMSPERRAEVEKKITELRSGDFDNSPSQILQFSLPQIQALDPKDVKNWTQSQRNALEQALNRLQGTQ